MMNAPKDFTPEIADAMLVLMRAFENANMRVIEVTYSQPPKMRVSKVGELWGVALMKEAPVA